MVVMMTIESQGLYGLKKDASLGHEEQNQHVTQNECIAIQALRADGRTIGDIAFMLERRDGTVTRHASGGCRHGRML